jgi:PKD repeat protein
MKSKMLLLNGLFVLASLIGSAQYNPLNTSEASILQASSTLESLVINEVDSDTPGFDDREFIELYGEPNFSLDGVTLVLYRGNNNTVYAAYDLSSYSLNAEGFFVVGNAAVSNVGLVIPDNTLRNGPDAIALYSAPVADFIDGTGIVLDNLLDALVYDTNDPDALVLLPLLLEGQPQVNEGANNNAALESMSRVPDGGAQRITETYFMQIPTPGTFNVPACDGAEIAFAEGDPNALTVCVDIAGDPISVNVLNSLTENEYALVITNTSNQIIEVVEGTNLNFFGQAIGLVRIWGIGYTGALNTASLQVGLPVTGVTSDACAALSENFITVDRQACIPPDCVGGAITVNSGNTLQSVCWNGDDPNLYLATNSAFTPNYVWVFTSVQGTILQYTYDDVFDLSTYGSGNFFVRGISFEGTLDETTLQPGLPYTGIEVIGCLSVSTNFVQVNSTYCAFSGGCSDLFISEYIEGSSNNKALELYNPTSQAVNMSGYRLETYNDGVTTPTNSLNLTGTLQPGEVYVIANDAAAPAILAAADITNSVTFFNGNDPIVLRKNGIIIDMMGIIGPEFDPLEPNGFLVNGGPENMSEYTLVRKPEATVGTPNWAIGQNQWEPYPQNTFSFLGSHEIGICETPDEPTISFLNSEITVQQGSSVQFGVATNWPEEEGLAEVVYVSGTAVADVDFEDIFTAELTLPVNDFTPQTLTFATYSDIELTEAVTVVLQLVPVTPALVQIEFLTVTIIPSLEPIPAPVLPIVDVHSEDEENLTAISENLYCELRGVVHGINYASTGLYFTLIDPTAGIAVQHPTQTLGYTVNQSDSVHVIGTIQQVNGLTTIVPESIQLISNNQPLQESTLVNELDETTESQMVELKCLELIDPAQWTNTGDWFDVNVTTGLSVHVLRIYAETNIFGTPAPEGVFSVVGIGSQFDEVAPFDAGYHLMPRNLADFTNPVVAQFTIPQELIAGQSYSFVNQSSGSNSFVWSFGDGNTSTQTSPSHTFEQPGVYNVILTAFDAAGVCSDQFLVEVEVIVISVEEQQLSEVRVYPNPAGAELTIESAALISGYRLFNAQGQMIRSEVLTPQTRATLAVGDLARGLYFIEVGGSVSRVLLQ